jgi:uncharacterized protein
MSTDSIVENGDELRVHLDDCFWSKYEKLIREVTIPYQWSILNDEIKTSEPSHAIRNFRIAAGLEKGDFYGFVFQDSDVAKWLEGAGCSLASHPDEKLEALADKTIDLIGNAQQPDGYLDTYFIIKAPEKRWTNLYQCHELYCAGHMIEAGVAYYKATGKRKLLDIVCRLADHIDSVFGPDTEKIKGYPGHQEIELALIKLYRVTGNQKYLNLSRYFIAQRGKDPYYFDEEWKKRGKTDFYIAGNSEQPGKNRIYNQSYAPVDEQNKAAGHAVRAVYMYTAMADLAAETGDRKLAAACRRIWNNIATTRLYLTGGIGATHTGEAFTFDYDLPNDTVYAETCASVGLIFFAQRMLHLEAKSNYADVMETALYNTVIASMSQDGTHFFYVNPLEVWPEACEKDPGKFHVKTERQTWFGCACCPPNLVRLIESLTSYIYSFHQDRLYVHLFIGSTVSFTTKTGDILLTQKTKYPWSGEIIFEISSKAPVAFELALRYPGWCRNAELTVNGRKADREPCMTDGYIILKRTWQSGDSVKLTLDMPVQLIAANPQVRADAGKAAIQRGPIVYCLEEADNGKNLSAISLSKTTGLKAAYDDTLMGGMVVVKGTAVRTDESSWGTQLYRLFDPHEKKIEITAIPYFMWGNRGTGEMQIWTRCE